MRTSNQKELLALHRFWKRRLQNIKEPSVAVLEEYKSQVKYFRLRNKNGSAEVLTDWLITFNIIKKETHFMRRKSKSINYLGYSVDKGFKGAKWYGVSVSNQSVKVYYDAFKILSGVSSYARVVLDIVLLAMDEGNFIINNLELKNRIREVLDFTDNTINKAFAELKESELMLQTNKRGHYYANPLFFLKEQKKIEN